MSFAKSVGAAAVAVLVSASGADAAVILNLDTQDPPEGQTDFQDDFVQDGDRAVAGPFGITFRNIVTPVFPDPPGPADPPPPGGFVDEDGLVFGRTGDVEIVSVDLVFDIPTRILEYDIDFVGEAVAFDADVLGFRSAFEISGPNGTSGRNFFDAVGRFAFDMGSIPIFLPGETYRLSHDIFDYGQLTGDPEEAGFDFVTQIDELVLATIPIPAPAALLLTALGALAAVRRRA